MYHIEKRNEWLATKLIADYSHATYAGVVAGHNPGEVWVDHPENPTSALVWSSGLECFQFMGRADNEDFNHSLGPSIELSIIPFLKNIGINFFEFAADFDEWYPIINQALAEKTINESWQYVYTSDDKKSANYSLKIPQPFEAVSINQEFISSLCKRDIQNKDFIINYLEQYWGTVENYLNKGYGYIALSGNKIVSIAVSTAHYKTTQEIGVETLEDYRRKGLSSSLVRMLLNVFYVKGIKPSWDCSDTNIASQQTIEKAGLVRDYRYKVNWFYF
jgi:GNAT superfamily N-acetyltransferase